MYRVYVFHFENFAFDFILDFILEDQDSFRGKIVASIIFVYTRISIYIYICINIYNILSRFKRIMSVSVCYSYIFLSFVFNHLLNHT